MKIGLKKVSLTNGLYDPKTEELILPSILISKLKIRCIKIIKVKGNVYLIPSKHGYMVTNDKLTLPKQVFKMFFGTSKKTELNFQHKTNKILIKCQD